MTDPEIIRTLAEREGWKQHPRNLHWYLLPGPNDTPEDWYLSKNCKPWHPPYLTSHDALKPVLAVMTDDEWMNLHRLIMGPMILPTWEVTRHLLSLPPRTLAEAVAKSLNPSEKPKS